MLCGASPAYDLSTLPFGLFATLEAISSLAVFSLGTTLWHPEILFCDDNPWGFEKLLYCLYNWLVGFSNWPSQPFFPVLHSSQQVKTPFT